MMEKKLVWTRWYDVKAEPKRYATAVGLHAGLGACAPPPLRIF